MEAIIKVRSKFDKSDYKKYLTLATFRGKKSTLPLLILIPLALSIFIPLALSNISGNSNNIFSLKGILFLYIPFLIISFAIVLIKLTVTNLKMKLVDTTNVFDTYNTFSFFEDEVVVENDNVEGKSPIKYSSFYKVLESEDYFILYFSDLIVSIIRKKDIDKEEELSKFIQRKLGKKYRKI